VSVIQKLILADPIVSIKIFQWMLPSVPNKTVNPVLLLITTKLGFILVVLCMPREPVTGILKIPTQYMKSHFIEKTWMYGA
jgi:hypothetical protein